MKRQPLPLLITAIVMIATVSPAKAQVFRPKYEYGLSLGVLLYQGDLTPERFGAAKTMKFAWALSAARILSPSMTIKGQFLRGRLRGDDSKYASPEYRQQRNFNFTTPVTELGVQLVYNPLGKNDADKGFAPYLFAGGGLAFLNIKRNWQGINGEYFTAQTAPNVWNGLAIDTAKSLPKMIPVIPAGAGLRYYINTHWSVNAETSYRFNYTDYLDGFSESVNPKLNDHYVNYSVGVVYRRGGKDKMGCPVVKY